MPLQESAVVLDQQVAQLLPREDVEPVASVFANPHESHDKT